MWMQAHEVFSEVTGGRTVFTSTAVGGGAPGPPKPGEGGNREGALPPRSAEQARIIHESVSRDLEDGRATGQPQGLESEAYFTSTSQVSRPEDARKTGHIHGRSSRFMNDPGYKCPGRAPRNHRKAFMSLT